MFLAFGGRNTDIRNEQILPSVLIFLLFQHVHWLRCMILLLLRGSVLQVLQDNIKCRLLCVLRKNKIDMKLLLFT